MYKQGFAALAAGTSASLSVKAGAASAIPDDPFSPKLWTLYEKIRTDFQR